MSLLCLLLFATSALIAVSHGANVCVERVGDACVWKLPTIKGTAVPTLFKITFGDGKCIHQFPKSELAKDVDVQQDTCRVTAQGCCCYAQSKDQKPERVDMCETAYSAKQSVFAAISFAPVVSAPLSAPHNHVSAVTDLKFSDQTPIWMWQSPQHLEPLRFNYIMYVVPAQHTNEVASYKLNYFAHHFGKTPFSIVIQALALILKTHIGAKQKLPIASTLIHHGLNGLYQGIKTYRFITEEHKTLDPSFATKVGDHLLTDGLIGADSTLQTLTAVFFNPYQVVGHIDPRENIAIAKRVWGAWKEAGVLDQPLKEALILIANIDCSSWARLYQRSMRTRGISLVPDSTVNEIPRILIQDIHDNVVKYSSYMEN